MNSNHLSRFPIIVNVTKENNYFASALDYPECKEVSDDYLNSISSVRRQLEERTWKDSNDKVKLIEPTSLDCIKINSLKGAIVTHVDVPRRYNITPKTLYYYIPISENLMKMLVEPYIWFSNPKSFNDPFELPDVFETKWTSGEEWEEFNYLYETFIDNKTSSKKYKTAQEAFIQSKIQPNGDLQYLLNAKISHIEEQIPSIGVSCFSRYFDNILMWSHYSNKHTGVVIGYKTDRLFVDGEGMEGSDVDYRLHPNKLRTGNYAGRMNQNLIDDYLLRKLYTKHPSWAYEQEFRLFSKNNFGKCKVNKESICELYFGCRIDPSIKSALMSVISGAKIDCYDMEKSNELSLIRKKTS